MTSTNYTRTGKYFRVLGSPLRHSDSLVSTFVRTVRSRKHSIFIAAMPKSASTFLMKALLQVTGFEYRQLCYAYERHEQNLYLPRLAGAYSKDTVSREHTKCTKANRRLLEQFEISPVVLVRNIFDVVPSIIDYVKANQHAAIPVAYFDSNFAQLDRTAQIDFVVELAIPWYIHFFVSWVRAEQSGMDIRWMTYDENVADWVSAVGSILRYNDIAYSSERIRNVISDLSSASTENIRLNRGIPGRGIAELSNEQRDRIINLTSHYRDVDFGMLGIDRELSAVEDLTKS